MKKAILIIMMAIAFTACRTSQATAVATPKYNTDTVGPMTQSLFTDKNASISEENIQRILTGSYELPQTLRVALVRIESNAQNNNYWNDELYRKTEQSYTDLFAQKIKQSPRVRSVSVIPNLLISKNPGFTNIREAAVRMQADIVVVYAISSDLYSKYKLFTRPDMKGFASTQLIIMDTRTGLIPFSEIVNKDFLSAKTKDDLDYNEASTRIQKEAVLLCMDELGRKMTDFLGK